MEEAGQLCDALAILHQGQLIARGSLEELKSRSADPNATLVDVFVQLTDQV